MSQSTAPDACPLPRAAQTRNLLIFGACTGLIYLAAPVLYIGVTQGALCKRLGASTTVANLPGSVYFLTMFMPVVIAWASPAIAKLKRNLVLSFLALAVILEVVALALVADIPDWLRLHVPLPEASLPVFGWFTIAIGPFTIDGDDWKVAAIILQGAVCGVATTTAVALLWEMIGRGVAEERRGLTLGIAFGLGPLLAVAGSLAHAVLVGEKLFGHQFQGLAYPYGFVALFGMGGPIMLLATLMASLSVVPLPDREVERTTFFRGVFGGIGEFARNRVLRRAAIVTILLYLGNTINSNLNLYSQQALGDDPDKFAGQQNALRFAFKFAAGLALGWILTRTNPRAGIIVTGLLYIGALLWAIFVTGPWYLVTFGIYGAGELVGVYAPNYILSASPKARIRQNMALMQLIMVPTAPAGTAFGRIAQSFGERWSLADGFRLSFAICAGLMALGLAIALLFLPPRPRPADR
jgi:hypothetical protein